MSLYEVEPMLKTTSQVRAPPCSLFPVSSISRQKCTAFLWETQLFSKNIHKSQCQKYHRCGFKM